MKGYLTEIISADICISNDDAKVFADKLKETYSGAVITSDDCYLFLYWELKNLKYTYYPQTYYEPSEWDCDDWIYDDDLKEEILKMANELKITIDIERISTEERYKDNE